MPALPASIENEQQLEDLLSAPTASATSALDRVPGDVLVLGAGGKIGLSLVRMLSRASTDRGENRRIVAVSRFQRSDIAEQFAAHGIETFRGDLLDESFLMTLPTLPNLIFMTGMKFGTRTDAALTWAMNVVLPTLVCRRFPQSRVLAYSTGNVYPFVPVNSRGSCEDDLPNPVGEYGMSALGRERIFEYYCDQHQQPTAIVRLNYAVEMRYGILVDLALMLLRQQPIDLSMGYANVIWQGDANAHAICALAEASVPARVVNVAGPELVDVREVCDAMAERMGVTPKYVNEPSHDALLSDARGAHERYGAPRVPLELLIQWTTDWVRHERGVLGKPTHFQTRNGRF